MYSVKLVRKVVKITLTSVLCPIQESVQLLKLAITALKPKIA